MDEPYTLYVSGRADTQGPAPSKPPPDLGNHIPRARPELIENNQVTIFRQSFSGSTIFIDLCFYRVARKTATVYASVKQPVLLFCYLLKGQIIHLKDQKKWITALPGSQYAGIYLLPGTYRLKPGKGNHLLLNFAFTTDFLLSVATSCPLLYQLVRSLKPDDEAPQIIPHCRIDFSVKRVITRLQKIHDVNNIVEPLLIGHMVELLMLYESRLQSGDFLDYQTAREKIYEVKEYIEQNYMRPNCQVNRVAGSFNLTRKALAREYKKEFGISIKEHIIQLRMAMALKLLKKNYLIKDITPAVGYENTSSFSRMFKKYYGYTPEEKKTRRKFFCLA